MHQITLCTLNYHNLHPGVTFVVMFDGISLHMTCMCFLLRWNKLKKLKHTSSKSIKTKANFIYISLSRVRPSPKFIFFSKPQFPPNPPHPLSYPSLCLTWVGQSIIFFEQCRCHNPLNFFPSSKFYLLTSREREKSNL